MEVLPTMDEFRNLGSIKESYSLEPLPVGTKANEDWFDLSEIKAHIKETLKENKQSKTNNLLFDEDLKSEGDEIEFMSCDNDSPPLYDEELEWSESMEDYVIEEFSQTEFDYVDNPQEEVKLFGKEIEYTEKAVDDLKNHLPGAFQYDLTKNPEEWVDLYKHIKNLPTKEDENAIKEYQNCSKTLVSNIFHRVLHKNKEINLYISDVNNKFYKYSGDNNTDLTLENRFLTDMYSGDLWTVPNMQISFFAERIPHEFLKNMKEAIYAELLSPDNNKIKENLTAAKKHSTLFICIINLLIKRLYGMLLLKIFIRKI